YQARLRHIELCPVDAVVQDALATAGQHFLALCRCQAKFVSDAVDDVHDPLLALCSEAQDWKHQRLIVGNGQVASAIVAGSLAKSGNTSSLPGWRKAVTTQSFTRVVAKPCR